MKVLLFHGNIPFNLDLKMRYLKAKGIDFWIYHCEYDDTRYRKIQLSKFKKSKIHEWDTFISLDDFGNDGPDIFSSMGYPKGCFRPKKDDYRFDKDLISIIEGERDMYFNIEVVQVNKGERFRILHDDSCDIEIIEMEKDIRWTEATE